MDLILVFKSGSFCLYHAQQTEYICLTIKNWTELYLNCKLTSWEMAMLSWRVLNPLVPVVIPNSDTVYRAVNKCQTQTQIWTTNLRINLELKESLYSCTKGFNNTQFEPVSRFAKYSSSICSDLVPVVMYLNSINMCLLLCIHINAHTLYAISYCRMCTCKSILCYLIVYCVCVSWYHLSCIKKGQLRLMYSGTTTQEIKGMRSTSTVHMCVCSPHFGAEHQHTQW